MYDAGYANGHTQGVADTHDTLFKSKTSYEYFNYYGKNNALLFALRFEDTSNATDFLGMTSTDTTLTEFPYIDTSKGTNFQDMFGRCSNLKHVPVLDTSKGENFSYMYSNCGSLEEVPALDTSNGTNFSCMFMNCKNLKSVPALDISNATTISNMFYDCKALKHLNIVGTIKTSKMSVQWCNDLTYESLITIKNALEPKTGDTYKIIFGATNLAKFTEADLAEINSKGWVYE